MLLRTTFALAVLGVAGCATPSKVGSGRYLQVLDAPPECTAAEYSAGLRHRPAQGTGRQRAEIVAVHLDVAAVRHHSRAKPILV